MHAEQFLPVDRVGEDRQDSGGRGRGVRTVRNSAAAAEKTVPVPLLGPKEDQQSGAPRMVPATGVLRYSRLLTSNPSLS